MMCSISIEYKSMRKTLLKRATTILFWRIFICFIFELKVRSAMIFCIPKMKKNIRSSKIAKRFGGVNGVYFSPTIPIKLLLLMSSTNCNGVPKSR